VHRAAAGESDLEGLLVGDPVGDEPRRAARKDVLRLVVDRRLDAAPGDGARHLALLGHGEHRARAEWRGALDLDDSGCGEPKALRVPALERFEHVLHAPITE